MTDRRSPDELFDSLGRHVGSWALPQLRQHGFDLLFGDPERLAKERRLHARRVLVAQHMVEDQVRHHDTPVILMKGLEVAMLYPRPIERPFRDVDLLVADPRVRWDRLVELGHRKSPTRALEIDHHHLPALEHPTGVLSTELHLRPNLPGWAKIPNDLIFDTAQPSRTGVEGALRPRDDVHALLLALHCWKGGFTRRRDLFDALLLDAVSAERTAGTAARLGLGRLWSMSLDLAEASLFRGRSGPATRWILSKSEGPRRSKAVLLASPLVAAGPRAAGIAHFRELRARRRSGRAQ